MTKLIIFLYARKFLALTVVLFLVAASVAVASDGINIGGEHGPDWTLVDTYAAPEYEHSDENEAESDYPLYFDANDDYSTDGLGDDDVADSSDGSHENDDSGNGYNEDEYPDDCEEYPTDCEEYPTDCEEYPTDCEEYPDDCDEYPTDCVEYPDDCDEYPNDCEEDPDDCDEHHDDCEEDPDNCQCDNENNEGDAPGGGIGGGSWLPSCGYEYPYCECPPFPDCFICGDCVCVNLVYCYESEYYVDLGCLCMIGIMPTNPRRVFFLPNGGNTQPGHGYRVIDHATNRILGMPQPPTRADFAFYGWNHNANGTGPWFDMNEDIIGDEDVNVFAIWGRAVFFTCTFVYLPGAGAIGGGDPSDPNNYTPRVVQQGGNVAATPGIVWPADPVRVGGFTFHGWFDSAGAHNAPGNQYTELSAISTNRTLHARWLPPSLHTVTFDYTGALLQTPPPTNIPGVNTRMVGDGYSISEMYYDNTITPWPRTAPSVIWALVSPTQHVAGWYMEPNGQGGRFAPVGHSDQRFPWHHATTPVYSNKTVFPRWMARVHFNINHIHSPSGSVTWPAVPNEPALFTAGYRSELYGFRYVPLTGGTVAVDGINHYGDYVGMPPVPTRPGYLFLGWFDTTDTTGGTEFTGDTNVTASRTVHARWEQLPLDTIILNAAGGTFDATRHDGVALLCGTGVREYNLPYGASFNSTSNPITIPESPTKPGYLFIGWYRDAIAPPSNTPNPQFPTVTPQNIGNAFANIQLETPLANPMVPVPGYLPIPGNPRFTASTYFFTGEILYARWAPYVTVTFLHNPGSGEAGWPIPIPMGPGNTPHHTNPQTPRRIPVGQRFSFMHGVSTQITGQVHNAFPGQDINTIPQPPTAADGGVTRAGVPNPNLWWGGGPHGENFTLNANPRPDHVFMGWNTDSMGEGDRVVLVGGAGMLHHEDITLYAQWAPTLTFVSNFSSVGWGCGTGDEITRNIMYHRSFNNHAAHVNRFGTVTGANPAEPDPVVFPRPGYWDAGFGHGSFTFTGWNTEPDGSGTTFTVDSIVTVPLRLYAQWGTNITFTSGVAPADSILAENLERPFVQGQPIQNFPPDPIWDGRTFTGWFNAVTQMLTNDQSVMNSPATLVARWAVIASFDANGGVLVGVPELSIALEDYPEGRAIGVGDMPQNPTRANWDFAGYWLCIDRVQMTYAAPIINRNWRFYAQWDADVIFHLEGGNIGGNGANVLRVVRDWAAGDPTIDNGNTQGMPAVPTKPGHIFSRWYTVDENDNKHTFDQFTPIEGHTNVHAEWSEPYPYMVVYSPYARLLGGTTSGLIYFAQHYGRPIGWDILANNANTRTLDYLTSGEVRSHRTYEDGEIMKLLTEFPLWYDGIASNSPASLWGDEFTHITPPYEVRWWRGAPLRDFLNNSFLDISFTTDERDMVHHVPVTSPYAGTSPEPAPTDTIDRVFLLSHYEATNTAFLPLTAIPFMWSRSSLPEGYHDVLGWVTISQWNVFNGFDTDTHMYVDDAPIHPSLNLDIGRISFVHRPETPTLTASTLTSTGFSVDEIDIPMTEYHLWTMEFELRLGDGTVVRPWDADRDFTDLLPGTCYYVYARWVSEEAGPTVADVDADIIEGTPSLPLRICTPVELFVENHKMADDEAAGRLLVQWPVEDPQEYPIVTITHAGDVADSRRFVEWVFVDDDGDVVTPTIISTDEDETTFYMPRFNVTAVAIWDYWLTFSGYPDHGGTVTATVDGDDVTSGTWVRGSALISDERAYVLLEPEDENVFRVGSEVIIEGIAADHWFIRAVVYEGSEFTLDETDTTVTATAFMTEPTDFVVYFHVFTVSVTKMLRGNMANPAAYYQFTIYFRYWCDDNDEYLPLADAELLMEISGEIVTVTLDANGSTTFQLRHRETAEFKGMPQNIYVRVVENVEGAYVVTIAHPIEGGELEEIPGNDTGWHSAMPIGNQDQFFIFDNLLHMTPPMSAIFENMAFMTLLMGAGLSGVLAVFETLKRRRSDADVYEV